MTKELEKQFFDTFGIEPKPIYSGSKLYNPFVTGYDYPTITDRILLELICILNKNELWGLPNDAKFLKQQVIQSCTMFVEHSRDCASVKEKEVQEFIHQVRTLFEEG